MKRETEEIRKAENQTDRRVSRAGPHPSLLSARYPLPPKRSSEYYQAISWGIVAALILLTGFRLTTAQANEIALRPIRLWSVRFLPDGKTLVTVAGVDNPNMTSARGECVFWDLHSNAEKFVVSEDSSARSVACSPDGQCVAVGEFNGNAPLIDPATGNVVATLTNADAVNAIAFSPDNTLLSCGILTGKVTVWNLATKESENIAVPDGSVLNLAVGPNHHALVATSRDGNGYLFDLAHPAKPVKVIAYVGRPLAVPNVEAVAFAPDGTSFVTGSQKCLREWNAVSGQLIKELAGATANINSAAFSPDGKILATVDADGGLTLWNPVTGESQQNIQAHSGTSFSVAYSPDGTRIATVGRDENNVKIWDARTLALLATLQRNPQIGSNQ